LLNLGKVEQGGVKDFSWSFAKKDWVELRNRSIINITHEISIGVFTRTNMTYTKSPLLPHKQ